MIKARDINKVKKEYKNYKKLLNNETDFIKQLKYKSLIREYEDKLMDIEGQLLDIEIGLYRDAELHKNVFIDKYINKIPVERLVDKYRVSRTTIYKISNKAKELFEGNRWTI